MENKEKKKGFNLLHLLWIVPLLALIIGGIYLYSKFRKMEKPFLTDASIIFDIPQKGSKSGLSVTFSLMNPNDISGRVDSAFYKLYIDNEQYAEGKLTEGFNIKANDTTTFTLPSSMDFKKFTENFKKAGVDSGLYRFELNLYGDIWKIDNVHIPYTLEKKMAVFKPLDFKMEKLKLKKIGLNETKIEALITLSNPNMIDLVSTTNYYEFYVEDDLWAKGNLGQTIDMPKKTKQTITAPIEIDPKEIIKKTGIFGQKDYKEKKFIATLQSTIKTKAGKEGNAKAENQLENIQFVLYYQGILGELIEDVQEKKEAEKEKKKENKKRETKIEPGLIRK